MFKSAFILSCAIACAVFTGLTMDDHLTSAEHQASAPQALRPQPISMQVTIPVNSGSATTIPKGSDGHYWAEAQVDNKAVKFLVDTGATVVALTPADALRLGVDPDELKFDHEVTTAMGKTGAAIVKLRSIGIGATVVRDVDAMVIKDGLSTSLLGMSYLGRLSSFEATQNALILHP